MKELVLTWNSGTQSRVIRSNQPGIAANRFRIGRDPLTCDLVLPSVTPEDLSVSKLHVEIYFDPDRDRFFLHNLKGASNPPKLYGQVIYDAPVAIDKNGVLQLGKREFVIAVLVPNAVTVPPTPLPESPKSDTKPLVCPHCHTGYTYEEYGQLNGRCPNDGFPLHGASVYLPQNH
ncbi:FHA domain-containing protein [Leptolyngbya sp. AN03gr2]|uniref:FHA domain-containing protein n=1 Tax=unclassified Leptolyngbya TaxID=2650499 RepID=UPI003D311727